MIYFQLGADEGEEEAEEEEEEEDSKEIPDGDESEPEIGKPLLTSVAEDLLDNQTPAWTLRCSSVVDPSNGYAIAASNVWPGAYAIAKER